MDWKQRPFEFRVWIEPSNRMIPSPEESGPVAGFMIRHDGTPSISSNETDFKSSLMQYIGRKDKSGVKMFEGDIGRDASGVVAVIVFDGLGFCANDGKQLLDITPKNEGDNIDCIEIIGNIFENPDLLEGAV